MVCGSGGDGARWGGLLLTTGAVVAGAAGSVGSRSGCSPTGLRWPARGRSLASLPLVLDCLVCVFWTVVVDVGLLVVALLGLARGGSWWLSLQLLLVSEWRVSPMAGSS